MTPMPSLPTALRGRDLANPMSGSAMRKALLAVLQLRPGDLDAQRELSRLYTSSGSYETETIELADEVLKRDPNDVVALQAKALTLNRAHEFREALVYSERLNQVDPKDINQQLYTLEILRKLGKTPQDLLHRVLQQQKAHPDDPRFEMLLAMTYGKAGQIAKGTELLERAAAHPVDDPQFIRYMVRLFDSLGRFDESKELLSCAAASDNVRVLRLLVQRLWQDHKPKEVIDRLDEPKAAAISSDATLEAFKALSLNDLHETDQAKSILDSLSHRTDDSRRWPGRLRFAPVSSRPVPAPDAPFWNCRMPLIALRTIL